MTKLSKEDEESLRRMREFEKRAEQVPENERVQTHNPRLDDDVAIGMNDKGDFFPVHDSSGREVSEAHLARREKARAKLDPEELKRLRANMSEAERDGLRQTIANLHANDHRTPEEDELLAEFEAYAEAVLP